MIVCDFLDFKTCCTSKNGSKCNFIAHEKKKELPTTCYWIQLQLGLLVLGGGRNLVNPEKNPWSNKLITHIYCQTHKRQKLSPHQQQGSRYVLRQGVNKEFQWINSHCSHQVIINFLLICRVMYSM